MDSIRIGVVGVGHMGSYHVAALAEILDANLVALADIDRNRVHELAGKYGAEEFTDSSDLIGRVDAVTIAVPTAYHHSISRIFLENGIHVLLEKPICNDLLKARELFQIATKNNLILYIGHVERFNGAVQELNRVVRDPQLIECRRLGPFSPRVQEDGVVLDLMIHDLDIVLRLVDKDIKEISAQGASILSDQDDIANVQIRFSDGCIANLTASRVTQTKVRTLSISQPDAYIRLDYADQELRIHRQTTTEHRLTREELKYREQFNVERVFVHKENPLKLELRNFLQAIHAGNIVSQPESELCSLEIALRVLKLINVPIPISY